MARCLGVEHPQCRICLANDSEGLLKPCHCRGSVAYVHTNCLMRWVSQSGSRACEICNHTYNLFAVTKPKCLPVQPRRTRLYIFLLMGAVSAILAADILGIIWITENLNAEGRIVVIRVTDGIIPLTVFGYRVFLLDVWEWFKSTTEPTKSVGSEQTEKEKNGRVYNVRVSPLPIGFQREVG